MTATQALDTLRRQAAATHAPALDDAELRELLFAARRPDPFGYLPDTLPAWEASQTVATGAAITPTVRVPVPLAPTLWRPAPPAGHFYVASVGGTGGTTEPTWPTSEGATVSDGTITWREAGRVFWTPTWDLAWATAEAWLRKAGYVADRYNVADSGQSLNLAQLYDHCEAMERRWRRKVLGQAPIAGRLFRPSLYPNLGYEYVAGLGPPGVEWP